MPNLPATYCLAWLLLLLGYGSGSAQSLRDVRTGLQLSVGGGISVIDRATILDERFERSAHLMVADATYSFTLVGPLALRTGIAARYIVRNDVLGSRKWRSRAWRLEVPLLLGIAVLPNTQVYAGVSVRNDKDLVDFDIRRSGNLRTDLVGRVSYHAIRDWAVFAQAMHGLGPVQQVTYSVDPRTQLAAGISYNLGL